MSNGMKQMEIGEIPEDWEVVKLQQIVSNFIVPMRDKPKVFGGDIPWCRIEDFTKIYLFRSKSGKCVNEKTVKMMNLKVYPVGTVLVSCSADLGKCAIVGQPLVTNQTFIGLVPKDEVSSLFLYYKMLSSAPMLNRLSSGTTISYLSREQFENFIISIPPLPEQRKIAVILSTVDEKIAVIDDQLAKTAELKTGLMQRLLTKGIGHTKFKDSPLGEIPESWEVVQLGEVARIDRGKFQQRPRNDPRFFGGTYPFVQTGDVGRAKGRLIHYSQTLNELGLSVSRLFPKGTVIITIAANIGDVAIAQFEVAFPDSLVGIVPNQAKLNNAFLMYFLVTQKENLNKLAPQSAQKNINLETLKPYKLPLPPLAEQHQIAELLATVDEKIQVLRDKKEHYQTLKRGLMQQLLTGKLRVRVAEDAVPS